MAFNEVRLREEYRTGYDDLVKDFYLPCLNNSIRYDRAVGYFRSSVFILIGDEIIRFAKRGGKIRLICSPHLSIDDIQAMSTGFKSRKEIAENAINEEIEHLLADKVLIKNTEALATLISLGIIDVKIAIRSANHGLYHEKIGLFYDTQGNCVSFKGSINETWNGWHQRGNYENFDVFCSWLNENECGRVKRHASYFNSLWVGEVQDLNIIDFPVAAKNKLIVIAKKELAEINPAGLINFFDITNIASEKENSRMESTIVRNPFQHQIQALEAWRAQGKKGILEHATGSGKTFTALIAIKEHLLPDGVALILVPDKLLHDQWYKEIKAEIPDAIILKAGNGNNLWRKEMHLHKFSTPGSGYGMRIILSTMATARLTQFIENICSGEHLMIVVDEVHEIGSKENSNALKINTGLRLGLSATPVRYGDPIGTEKIFDYFGPIIQPPFSLFDAIKSKRLVEYEYFPEAIKFTAEESDSWELATKEISKEFARSKRDANGNPIQSSRLKNMLIQRSRIAKKAAAKVPYAVKVICNEFRQGESWLVYCEDQYQLAEVMLALQKEGYSPCEYHTSMKGDAPASLDWFKQFGGIMVSIRCLDQGVDIPKISHAIILASSQNPRQFIQRRGRVLRSCPGKYKAVIYDAVIVPVCLDQEPGQLSLLKSELQRSIQFSKMAMNLSGSNKLITIAINYGIDPNEIGILNTAGFEDGESNE